MHCETDIFNNFLIDLESTEKLFFLNRICRFMLTKTTEHSKNIFLEDKSDLFNRQLPTRILKWNKKLVIIK